MVASGMEVPALTTDMVVVFGLVAVAVTLFVGELLPPDVTAIAIIVSLVLLSPWTAIEPEEAISGFSSSATITILAMYVLSAGVQETGAVRRLGGHVAEFTGQSKRRLLGVVVGLTGTLAGFINNTPVVAMFIPMVTDLADEMHVSPSKLLIPLSYASMLGGVLTLIGTATNILASDLSRSLSEQYPRLHPFSMFEFTPLGVFVLLVGVAYLLTIGQRLLPERVHAVDLTAEFDLEALLSRIRVRRRSPLVGLTVSEAMFELRDQFAIDVDVLQVIRGDRTFIAPRTDQEIEPGDVLTVRGAEDAVLAMVGLTGLERLPHAAVTEDELADPEHAGTLVELVIPPDSSLDGETIAESGFRERFGATVLAVRHGAHIVHEDLPTLRLDEGDGLLVHAPYAMVEYLGDSRDLIVTETARRSHAPDQVQPFFETKAPLAIGTVAAVVAVAALDILPIVIAALGGVVVMIVGDVIDSTDAYDAVSWEIIFLLAGVIPLGLALQKSGGAAFLASAVVANAEFLPAVVVLGLFYLLTGLLANVITPVASVVLMIPIAADAAARIGANEFAFVIAVTFAASTAFMTPIGYQTNLMVYSPGGYRFVDYLRVGAPLQLLLTIVTPLGIDLLWGVTPA